MPCGVESHGASTFTAGSVFLARFGLVLGFDSWKPGGSQGWRWDIMIINDILIYIYILLIYFEPLLAFSCEDCLVPSPFWWFWHGRYHVRADANEVPTQCWRVNMEWNWISPRWKQWKGSFDILGVAETASFFLNFQTWDIFCSGVEGEEFAHVSSTPNHR